MAGLDCTVIFHILQKLSGFDRPTISRRLHFTFLKNSTLKTSNSDRFVSGYINAKNAAPKVVWIDSLSWRATIREYDITLCEYLDKLAASQAFPDQERKGEYTFESHLYEVLKDYSQKHHDPFETILQCCRDVCIDRTVYSHQYKKIQEYASSKDLDGTIRFIISTAKNAPCCNDKRVQVYIAATEFNDSPFSPQPPVIKTYEELLAAGMTSHEISRALVSNDKRLYTGIPLENSGSIDLWEQYLSSFPATFRYLVAGQDIIGNWSIMALGDQQQQQMEAGILLEGNLQISESAFLFLPGIYTGFILNLSVNEAYMTIQNYALLFRSFADQLLEFAKSGVLFRKFYVNVFREDHASMYKTFGFRFHCDNISFGKIYRLEMNPLPTTFINLSPELKGYYAQFELNIQSTDA